MDPGGETRQGVVMRLLLSWAEMHGLFRSWPFGSKWSREAGCASMLSEGGGVRKQDKEEWRVRKEDDVLVFERRAGQGPKLRYGPPPAGSGFTVDDGSWRNMNEADLCALRPGS